MLTSWCIFGVYAHIMVYVCVMHCVFHIFVLTVIFLTSAQSWTLKWFLVRIASPEPHYALDFDTVFELDDETRSARRCTVVREHPRAEREKLRIRCVRCGVWQRIAGVLMSV